MMAPQLWFEVTQACGHTIWTNPNGYGIDAADVVKVAEMVAAIAQRSCRTCAPRISTRHITWADAR